MPILNIQSRKKYFNLNIVCYAGNRAAVLTLLVRMPTGGSSYAPPGVPGDCPKFALFLIKFILILDPWLPYLCPFKTKLLGVHLDPLLGIALASSLVTLGNPRKASVDPTQKVVLFIWLKWRICLMNFVKYLDHSVFRWSRQIPIQSCGRVERW